MDFNIIYFLVKTFSLNICFGMSFTKIIHFNKDGLLYKILCIAFNVLLTIIQGFLVKYISTLLSFILTFTLYGILLGIISNSSMFRTLSISIISISLSYISSLISIAFSALVLAFFKKIYFINLISVLIMALINITLIYLFFMIKRFKDGFLFIENDYLNLLILLITTIVLFNYILIRNHPSVFYVCSFFTLSIFAFAIIIKSFFIYQRERNKFKALKDYEAELAETSQKLQTALEEKEKLIKTNHEFYHRQEALKNKLNQLITSSTSTEAANEYSNILDRINNLSQEYSAKLAVAPKLQSTNIEEIDDMLSYFQSECIKNNIEFIFKLDCNIDKIITEHIDKSNLETLIGDLLRNAIIAINNSSNMYRSIMLVFGLKDSCYQIDIYDSGVEFKIETLLKLGLEKASTYIGNGGTGIGMLTTFETLNKTKSSLTITEFEKNSSSYTKLISIKSDKQNNYCINSPRADIIKKSNIDNRNIIIK